MGVEEDNPAEQATAARRERLKALRAAKELLSTPDTAPAGPAPSPMEDGNGLPVDRKLNVKFRNYLPHDKQLQEHKLAPPILPKFEDPIAAAPIPDKIEDPFLNIAPKKPNWDLRRDVQKKLDKLERRTEKALYELYVQKVKQDLASEQDATEQDATEQDAPEQDANTAPAE